MASFNRAILAGNMTRDPQLSYTPSGAAVCEFGLAMNRKWRGQDGNAKEEVCFVDVTAYGKPAEVINQYMTKGRSILVEGRLRYRQWTDKEGKNRTKLDVVVENFTFLGDRGGGGQPGQPGQQRPSSRPGAAAEEPMPADDMPPPQDPDIPF